MFCISSIQGYPWHTLQHWINKVEIVWIKRSIRIRINSYPDDRCTLQIDAKLWILGTSKSFLEPQKQDQHRKCCSVRPDFDPCPSQISAKLLALEKSNKFLQAEKQRLQLKFDEIDKERHSESEGLTKMEQRMKDAVVELCDVQGRLEEAVQVCSAKLLFIRSEGPTR